MDGLTQAFEDLAHDLKNVPGLTQTQAMQILGIVERFSRAIIDDCFARTLKAVRGY